MSFVKEVSKWLLAGINGVIESIDDDEISEMIDLFMESRDSKILIIGTGRSGFVGRAFALRLMHLDFNVYVSGETITPALTSEDLVVAVSGSGVTRTVVAQAEVAKEIGAKVIAVTSHFDSTLAKFADMVVVVRGRSKIDMEFDYDRRQITGEHDSAPLGTMFELSALVFFDCIIADLMRKLSKGEMDLRKKHANAE